jgi:hypothetical protein
MAERARARPARARPSEESSRVSAREVAELARQYIEEMTERQPVQMTSVSPIEDGWLVEVEVIEDRRIPSSSDILALYEVELDENGELLAYRRTRRYLRGQTADGGNGA